MTKVQRKKEAASGHGINRTTKTGSLAFIEVFPGFESVEAVKSIVLDQTERILGDLMVDILPRAGYLRVDDETGNIVVSSEYLRMGDERYLYLDVIHELVHIRQFIEGKELFDSRYSYVDRPTEIEAYTAATREAEKIGMKKEEILDYLKVEWVTEEEFQRLLRAVDFDTGRTEQDST
jgi:hypothetical protein